MSIPTEDLAKFRERMKRTASGLAPNVCNLFRRLLVNPAEEEFKIGPDEREKVNSMMLEKATSYDSEAASYVGGVGRKYVYKHSKMIPVSSMPWVLATAELVVEHGYELGVIATRCTRALVASCEEKYGKEAAKDLLTEMQEEIELKNMEWNRIIADTVWEIVTQCKNYTAKDWKDAELELTHMIYEVVDIAWVSGEEVDIESQYKECEHLEDIESQVAYLCLHIISELSIKSKMDRKEHPDTNTSRFRTEEKPVSLD